MDQNYADIFQSCSMLGERTFKRLKFIDGYVNVKKIGLMAYTECLGKNANNDA